MPRKHRVEVSRAAQRDLLGHYWYIAGDSVSAARRWLSEFHRRLRTLNRFPFRCPLIPEAEELGAEYRHLLYGPYRAIYRVDRDRVFVVRVLHGAQLLDRETFGF